MTTGSLSKRGAGACAAFEAVYLYAYPDPGTRGEPYTIGVGHTRAAGLPSVKLGDRISLARAFEIYASDMQPVQRDVRAAVHPQQSQPQFDALCSFHLNTGALRSGSIDDKLNRGDVEGALATWGQYVNAGGRRMQGLANRRAAELRTYRTGVYPSSKIALHETPTGMVRTINPDNIPWTGDAPVPAPPADIIALDRPLPAAPATPRQAVSWWSWIGRIFA